MSLNYKYNEKGRPWILVFIYLYFALLSQCIFLADRGLTLQKQTKTLQQIYPSKTSYSSLPQILKHLTLAYPC